MTDGPLGRIYSLDEAAEYLRTTKQMISRTANRHGIGARFGRDIRFTEADVKEMWEAMRTRSTSGFVREPTSPVFVEEKAWASLRKMAEAKRKETLRLRAARKGR